MKNQLSIHLNEKDRAVVDRLMKEHGINISMTVKLFLKEKLERLDKMKKEENENL